MSIDITTETVITLAEAARLIPARRRGRKTHVSCIYRWTTAGCRGVVLESVQVGGTRCTSREALARFFERLTSRAAPATRSGLALDRSVAERRRAIERAGRELDQLGI